MLLGSPEPCAVRTLPASGHSKDRDTVPTGFLAVFGHADREAGLARSGCAIFGLCNAVVLQQPPTSESTFDTGASPNHFISRWRKKCPSPNGT